FSVRIDIAPSRRGFFESIIYKVLDISRLHNFLLCVE
ncbi:unnamed protein product, partial [Arabidopsis halleri]